MAQQLAWEKPKVDSTPKAKVGGLDRLKFLIGGLLILGAVGYLLISGTMSGARFFITIEDLTANTEYIGETVRISGAVIGETIEYDSENLTLAFTVSHIPQEFEDLALALHESVNDPAMAKISVYMEDEVKPDLLQHEAQAIMTGTLGSDGIFYADELLLKCPSRFEENMPAGVTHPEVVTDAG